MVGKKHSAYSHEALILIKERQINPYSFNPIEMQANDTKKSKYAIKLSEVFQVLKNIENFNLQVDKKYKIKYAVFGDVLLQLATQIHFMGDQANTDDVDADDSGTEGQF